MSRQVPAQGLRPAQAEQTRHGRHASLPLPEGEAESSGQLLVVEAQEGAVASVSFDHLPQPRLLQRVEVLRLGLDDGQG